MHPHTLNNLTAISAHQMSQRGKHVRAEEASHEALERYEKGLDSDRPGTVKCVMLLASLLVDQEDYEAVEKMYRCLLHGKALRRECAQTTSIAGELELVLSEQGKYEEEEMRRSILETDEEVLGGEHPQTLKNFSELASVLRVQRKYDAAGAMRRLLLERQVQALTAHQDSLSNLMNWMLLLSRQGKPREVERISGLTEREFQGALR
jgi:hypothetical protein